MRIKNLYYSLLLAITFLTACGGTSYEYPTVTAVVQKQTATLTPTFLPTITHTPTSTSTSIPSRTLVPSRTPIPTATYAWKEESGYNLVNGKCTTDECLIDSTLYTQGTLFGIAKIKGYYTQITEEVFGEKKLCDNFIIVEGSHSFISSIKGLIAIGNSVNGLNESGGIIIDIDLKQIESFQQTRIITSSKNNLVELLIFRRQPVGRGVRVCESVYEILKVK